MPKTKKSTSFICNNCGTTYTSWVGRCQSCLNWNTVVENIDVQSFDTSNAKLVHFADSKELLVTAKLRHKSIKFIDTVLGGGIMPGSIILLSGQPGIGKSTVLLQVAAAFKFDEVMYISGEESAEQVASRALRLLGSKHSISVASTTDIDDIVFTLAQAKPKLVIIDSIQTMKTNQLSTPSGSVAQINACTSLLTDVCKKHNIALIIVGHVTKDGNIAGPKMLEHMVDVVLNLEGDRYGGFKVLRAIKNRYGSTSEIAILEMNEKGLMEVDNPSAALLEERQISDGSIVLATMEGTRAVLVEVQALVNETAFGMPRRAVSGFDLNRLNLLIAVLEKRTKLNLSQKDIYVNIVGGLKVNEPAADLAIIMAIASASKSMKLQQDLVVFGEVGLSGEVRRVSHLDKRLNEALKLGFAGCLGPKPLQSINNQQYNITTSIKTALNQFLQKS